MKLKNTREIRKIAKNSSIIMCLTLFVVGLIIIFFIPAVMLLYVEFVKAMGIIIIPLVVSIGFNSAVGKMNNIMETIMKAKANIDENVGDMSNE